MGFRGSLIDFVAGYVGFRYFSIHTIEVDSVAEGGFWLIHTGFRKFGGFRGFRFLDPRGQNSNLVAYRY